MSGVAGTLRNNAGWELTRLRRSRRLWLLFIPVVAGPLGSSIANLLLKVPSVATAQVLGLLITGGLGALVMLDLVALAVGEDLALRTHFLTFVLPQGRASALGGRLLLVTAGSLGAYGLGGAGAWWLAALLVTNQAGAAPPILVASHLYLGLYALLLFLGGVAAVGSVVTRSSAQGLVAGVLAGVVTAGGASFLLLQHQLTVEFPIGLALAGVASLGGAVVQYGRIDA